MKQATRKFRRVGKNARGINAKKKTAKRIKNAKRKNTKNRKPKNAPIAYGHVFSTECGHCINMQGDWDKLKGQVGKDIELLDISDDHQEKVNTVNSSYQTDLKFSGFPTIFKLKRKNTPVEYYQGDRTTGFMKKWLYS